MSVNGKDKVGVLEYEEGWGTTLLCGTQTKNFWFSQRSYYQRDILGNHQFRTWWCDP